MLHQSQRSERLRVRLRRWASYKGRIGRQEFIFAHGLLPLSLLFLSAIVDAALGVPLDTVAFGPFTLLGTVIFYYGLVVGIIKRWHDQNESGWHALWVLVPLLGPLYHLMYVVLFRGTVGPNRFGPDPVE